MIETLSLISLVLVCSTLALVVWNVSSWPAITTQAGHGAGRVSVLIPARNEAASIEGCIESALAGGAAVHEVIVCDDRSTDGTAASVRSRASSDRRVRLVEGRELPAGWCGKTFACAQLAETAGGDWLLFLDADARLARGAADRLLAEAASRRATMISAWPGLEMHGFWERVLMPMLNVVTFSLYPAPLAFTRSDPSLGLAHGACILAERSAYERVGGHAAVRAEIFEDQRLAQLWRSRGERSFCLDGQAAVTVRMYSSFSAIFHGFQKNFYPAFRHEYSFWGYVLLNLAIFVLPMAMVILAFSWISATALAGVVTIRLLLVWRFNHPVTAVLFHPVAETVLLAIALSSWWRCRSGRGVEWKGRRYLDDGTRGPSA